MKRNNAIAIFGLGFVGLPLSLFYCMKGYTVYGIDVSKELVDELNAGITRYIEQYNGVPIRQILADSLESGAFIPSVDASDALKHCDKFILTVGIPVNDGELDFEPLKAACCTVSTGLKKGDTVMIRSTVVPGTTEKMLVPILESSGLKAGADFNLVYCPERISEGSAFKEFEEIPVVISGINKKSLEKGMEIIKIISRVNPLPVSSIKTAEMSKVVENIQRDVNIAIVQQLATLCGEIGIDIYELIASANSHPRVNLLIPGPGVGGFCIPNALSYLKPVAEKTGADIGIFSLARKINGEAPLRIATRIIDYLISAGKSPAASKTAVLGIAMKDFSDDDRQSPAKDIIASLMSAGMDVKAYDPCVAAEYPYKVNSIRQCLEKADCILIVVLQRGIDYNDFKFFRPLVNRDPVIFDAKRSVDVEKAEKSGFKVIRLI